VTRLLLDWQEGRRDALDQVLPLVYAELRQLAARYMKRERAGHTLQATALVHEAYARLVDTKIGARSRAQFFALASRAMRNVLVDHARSRGRGKRGGDAARVTLDEAILVSAEARVPGRAQGSCDRDARLRRDDPRGGR
jgi:RNA polymerase sigma factor (TIGR02999 family)